MRPLKVLVADDEYWVRENLCTLLSGLGRPLDILIPADDGEQALARLEAERPDVLITDIDMPFLDGNQLIKAAKTISPEVQIVVLSGYSKFAYVREALIDGALDYLLKPVEAADLTRVLDQAEALRDQTLMGLEEAAERTDRYYSQRLQYAEQPAEPLPWNFTDGASLLLLKTGELAPSAWNPRGDPRLQAAKVRMLAAREASGAEPVLIFQNQFSRREWAVVTAREPAAVPALAERLADNLHKQLGCRIEIAVSLPFYAEHRLRDAYREAKAAFLARTAAGPNVVFYETIRNQAVEGRVTPEHEKVLGAAVAAGDLELVRDVLFSRIGLRDRAATWRLAEVQRTVEYLVRFLLHRSPVPAAARSGLAQEAFEAQLAAAVDAADLGEVCALLDGWIDELLGTSQSAAVSVSMRQTVQKAAEFVQDHYFDNLSLASLARTFRVDSSYLSKAYKQITGVNLMSAIARCRVEKAKEFIRERDLSLTEVASLVGYEEYAYFNRVFHKVEGQSPSEFKAGLTRSP
jgi:DNA-binding NarL/FixJ family response regulator/AraC-like DNA-binding protein